MKRKFTFYSKIELVYSLVSLCKYAVNLIGGQPHCINVYAELERAVDRKLHVLPTRPINVTYIHTFIKKPPKNTNSEHLIHSHDDLSI